MNIYCIKLSSGEELLAKVISDETVNDAIILENVFTVGLQRTGPSEVRVGMTPWCVGNPGARVNINLQHIITSYLPADELVNNYIQQTTGIQLA